MAVAAGLIIGQADYKRMLAYSSVEHMGILAVGIGLGGQGDWGALFHAVNHSLTKAALFLLAGNILAAYGTKKSARRDRRRCAEPARHGRPVGRRLLRNSRRAPFGAFSSELTILRARGGRPGRGWWWSLYSLLLAAVFVGMIGVLVRMAQGGGQGDGARGDSPRELPWDLRAPSRCRLPCLSIAVAAA